MSGRISPHQIALACGTNGAYVDVTSYVEFGEGITFAGGRQDQFSDTTPQTFTFTLNNSDGRFTPGNTGSPLATTVTEGMGVSWLLGTRLVHTTILSVEIPADNATWHQLRVTCDDMLGTAGRHELTSIADGLTAIYNPPLFWRLDEPSGATAGLEQTGSPLGAFTASSSSATTSTTLVQFGQTQNVALPGTAVTVTAGPGETTRFGTTHGNTVLKTSFGYPIPTDTTVQYVYGSWAFWVYPGSTITFNLFPYWTVGAGYSDSAQIIVTPSSVAVKGGVNAAVSHTYTAAESTSPHYLSLYSTLAWQTSSSYWAHELQLYLDGTLVATTFMQSAVLGFTVPTGMLSAGTAMQPLEVGFNVIAPSGGGALSGTVQRVVHTLSGSLEQNALYNTEDQRRAVLDTLAWDVSSAAYDGRASLWSAPIGFPDVSNRSVLDVYNDIVRTEQGHLFCTTTGSLTSPSEQIQVRDRDRPTAVKAAFRATDGTGPLQSAELDGLPSFVRDITNVAESVDVAGPTRTVTVTDPTVLTDTARAITAGLSETVLLTDPGDLRLWGQDRLNRGKNVAIRVQQFTVDAVTTATDRSADLLALVPGDRVQLTGLPVATLGFSTWDGWVLARNEAHTVEASKFTFTVAPVLPAAAVADTALAGNGGSVVLAAAMTATDTSISVTSNDGTLMSTATPYTITVGTSLDQCTVTAVTGAGPGQTLTVTRAAGAIAHTTAAAIEVSPVPLTAF